MAPLNGNTEGIADEVMRVAGTPGDAEGVAEGGRDKERDIGGW